MWITTARSPSMCVTTSGTTWKTGWDNWDGVVALSFLSYDDSFYELLPYEAITEEEYLRRKQAMKPFNPSLISKYEHEESELDIGDLECVNGVCPVR